MTKHGLRILAITAAVTVTFGNPAFAGAKKPSSGQGWQGATVISPTLQPDPTRGSQLNDVAVNANGVTLAAWDQNNYYGVPNATIGAAVQSGGRWSPPFTISSSGGFAMAPRVAVGSDGTMAVSWTYQDGSSEEQIQVAVKEKAASAWSLSTIGRGPIGGVSLTKFVPIGIDANGNITAVWYVWNGSQDIVHVASKPAGGTWSSPIELAPAVDALYPELAVNASGDAAVVYSMSPYSAYMRGTAAQYVFREGPNGTWTSPVTITETIPDTVGYVQYPQVALDANGLATVIYKGTGVEATRQLSSGSWVDPKIVLPAFNPTVSFTSIDLALDQTGNAVVAASIFDATINVDRASVWVSRGDPFGNWTQALRITDPAVPVDAYATRVAVSPDGTLALVGWIDHYHGTVQVAQSVGNSWSTSTIGRGTAWAAFQEVLGLDAGSGTCARVIWKSSKSGLQIMAAGYNN